MKGGEITLDSIDSTIKEKSNPIPNEPESSAKRILMTPFRVLGMVIETLARVFGPLGRAVAHLVRIFFGLIIFFIGLVLTISPLLVLGVFLGITEAEFQNFTGNFPSYLFTDLVPVWLLVATCGLIFIPGIIILLLGLSVLAQKNLINGKFGLAVLALWLLCIGIAGFQIPKIVGLFKEENQFETKAALPISKGVIILKVNDVEDEELFNKSLLQLVGIEDTAVYLTQEFSSRGKTKAEALENAKKLAYSYGVMDSVITFEEGYDLSSLESFRGQRINLTLGIPYDRPFIMEKSLLEILEKNTIWINGYRSYDVRPEAVWVFNSGGLICLTCPGEKGKRKSWEDWNEEKPKVDSLNKAKLDSISRTRFRDAYFMKD